MYWWSSESQRIKRYFEVRIFLREQLNEESYALEKICNMLEKLRTTWPDPVDKFELYLEKDGSLSRVDDMNQRLIGFLGNL